MDARNLASSGKLFPYRSNRSSTRAPSESSACSSALPTISFNRPKKSTRTFIRSFYPRAKESSTARIRDSPPILDRVPYSTGARSLFSPSFFHSEPFRKPRNVTGICERIGVHFCQSIAPRGRRAQSCQGEGGQRIHLEVK